MHDAVRNEGMRQAPNTKSVLVGGSSSAMQCFDPVFAYPALDAVTAVTPGTMKASATLKGGTSLGDDSTSFQVMPANAIDWVTQTPASHSDMAALSAVFVRPNDPAVTQLRSDAEKLSIFSGGYGVVPAQHVMAFPNLNVPVNTYASASIIMEAGESLAVTMTSVSGGDGTITFLLFNESEFTKWASNQQAQYELYDPAATSGTVKAYVAPVDGGYRIVFLNPNSNFLSRTVSWTRTSTSFDAAFDAAQSMFLALRKYGLTYSNIASADLDGIQTIRTPAKVIANKAGNCIEGSLLFASVAENIGFEPYVHVFNCPKDGLYHALVAIRTPGAKTAWPIETTQVGDAMVSPVDAMNTALNEVAGHLDCDFGYDVKLARMNHITAGQ